MVSSTLGRSAVFIPFPASLVASFCHILPFTVALLLTFYAISRRFSTSAVEGLTMKQQSWILTTIVSSFMTAASLPFLFDYIRTGGGVDYLRTMAGAARPVPVFALWANRFFQAYLLSDLVAGFICYKGQIALLTGWVHHILYIGIVELAIRGGWAHIFCLCAFMELPTFMLGASILNPRLRSNVLFAGTFFATRIVFHIALGVTYAREPTTRVPAGLLAMMFPMHAFWFLGAINGFIRRRKSAAISAAVPVPRTVHIEGFYVPSTPPRKTILTSAPIYLRTVYSRPRMAARRESFDRLLNNVRAELLKAEEKVGVRIGEPFRRVYGALPAREAVYNSVGLGRRRSRRGELRNGATPQVAVY